MSRFIDRRPILSALLAVVLVKVATLVLSVLITSIYSFSIGDSQGPMVIAWATVTLAVFLVLRRQGWASSAGFNRPARWKEVWLAWLPFVYAGLPFINLIWRDLAGDIDPWVIAASAANGLVRGSAVALLEETTFRGLVLAILLNRLRQTRAHVRRAVLLSGLLFGLWHLPVQPHWETNLSQWVYAAFAGVGFAAVVLRTRSIWLLIAAHALLIVSNFIVSAVTVDVPASLTQVRWGAVMSVLMMLPLLVYGLYLIRDAGPLDLGFSGGPGHELSSANPSEAPPQTGEHVTGAGCGSASLAPVLTCPRSARA